MREPLPPAPRSSIKTVGALRDALGLYGPDASLTCLRGLLEIPNHDFGRMEYLDSGERAYVFLGSDGDLKAKGKEHKDGSITWSVKFRTPPPPRRKA